jgi:hypothetical protein
MQGLGETIGIIKDVGQAAIRGVLGVNEVTTIEIPNKIRVQTRDPDKALLLVWWILWMTNELDCCSEKSLEDFRKSEGAQEMLEILQQPHNGRRSNARKCPSFS